MPCMQLEMAYRKADISDRDSVDFSHFVRLLEAVLALVREKAGRVLDISNPQDLMMVCNSP